MSIKVGNWMEVAIADEIVGIGVLQQEKLLSLMKRWNRWKSELGRLEELGNRR